MTAFHTASLTAWHLALSQEPAIHTNTPTFTAQQWIPLTVRQQRPSAKWNIELKNWIESIPMRFSPFDRRDHKKFFGVLWSHSDAIQRLKRWTAKKVPFSNFFRKVVHFQTRLSLCSTVTQSSQYAYRILQVLTIILKKNWHRSFKIPRETVKTKSPIENEVIL